MREFDVSDLVSCIGLFMYMILVSCDPFVLLYGSLHIYACRCKVKHLVSCIRLFIYMECIRLFICMRWLRLVGSLKFQVSFAEYRLFNRALLQKRPIILRSLLLEATP